MADVEFKDNSIQVKAAINEKAVAFLHEVAGELAARSSMNVKRQSGQTANSYTYSVDEKSLSATFGSPLENAVWEELGTGEYAVNGDGRKGYWVFVEGQSKGGGGGKTLDLASAKRAMAMLRRKGLNAYYTKGKRPRKPIQKAVNSSHSFVESTAEKYFGELN